MQHLNLDIQPYATDLTACSRCGEPVLLGDSWPLVGGGRICPTCVTEAVEAHRLATVTDHEDPSRRP
ncbi:hypothetical protein [Nonomuraea salmonea]|uniref:ClpX-type ZB domain-containing protein n=1 Tax=Nonomuraea salmonea TaxID=46181 RepID=A0ABV5NPF1_9ACTN